MQILLILIIFLLLVGFGFLLFLFLQMKRRIEAPKESESFKVMMEWMKDIKSGTELTRDNMQKNLNETNRAINERLDKAASVIGALSRELGSMNQIGPDIKRLSDVLASPKTRGTFGEEMLENMLSQVLPKEAYATQYRFSNGEVVDVIVRVGERLLPIDSKFSIENFRLYKEAKTDDAAESAKKAFLKDVKKRIDEIYKKYILPQENTFDFALMYIQSEGVFSEVLEDTHVVTYARDKRVFFVSPNTLYHYLQIILLSLKGQQINKAAQAILHHIAAIRQESEKFGKNLDVLANHIKNANNSMSTVAGDFGKLKNSIGHAASLQLASQDSVAIEAQEIKELIKDQAKTSSYI